MNDELLKKLIEYEKTKDTMSFDSLIRANTKLVDENTIIKKELKKCYSIIDNIKIYCTGKKSEIAKDISRIIEGE